LNLVVSTCHFDPTHEKEKKKFEKPNIFDISRNMKGITQKKKKESCFIFVFLWRRKKRFQSPFVRRRKGVQKLR